MPAKGKQLKTLEIGGTTFGNDFTYLGNNITGGVANDTKNFWRDKGSGYAWFSTANQVNDQKNQYGFLINIVNETDEVHQEWWTQGAVNGGHFYRRANADTTAMGNWTKMGVAISGDTMTGNLLRKVGTVDAKLANNGVSTTQTSTMVFGQDKNGLNYSFLDSYARSDGSISGVLFARNFNTSGDIASTAYLSLHANKDGSTKAVINATKPASNTNDTQIATTAFVQDAINRRLPKSIISATLTSFSCANNSNQTKNLWTAPAAGIVVATLHVQFAANTTGARNVMLITNKSGMAADTKVSACSSGVTKISVTGFRSVEKDEKLQATLFQNSGGALTTSGSLTGYFIYS